MVPVLPATRDIPSRDSRFSAYCAFHSCKSGGVFCPHYRIDNVTWLQRTIWFLWCINCWWCGSFIVFFIENVNANKKVIIVWTVFTLPPETNSTQIQCFWLWGWEHEIGRLAKYFICWFIKCFSNNFFLFRS